MELKNLIYWHKYRPNSFKSGNGKIPLILVPRIKNILDKGLQTNILMYGSGGEGKCVSGETLIKVRNKDTGEIIEIEIKDLL